MAQSLTQGVADRRLENWLEQWGRVHAVRLDGGILPDTRGEAQNKRPNRGGIPNLSAQYADLQPIYERAPVLVRLMLTNRYAQEGTGDAFEIVAKVLPATTPVYIIRQVARRVEQDYRAWRREAAASLSL